MRSRTGAHASLSRGRSWLVALVPLVWLGWTAAGTPFVVVLATVLPGLAWAAALAWLARVRGVSIGGPAATFGLVWGAGVAALGSGRVNDVLLAHGGGMLVPVFVAPLVEEVAKGAVLVGLVLLWSDELRCVRAGIVAGGLVGVGFAVAENLSYLLVAALQGGPTGLLRGVWVRGLVEGGVHAVFAASTGAGVGYARAGDGRKGALIAGLGAAVVQHVAWNGLASRAVTHVLCNPVVSDGPCQAAPDIVGLVVTIPLVVLAALGPGTLAVAAIALRQPRATRRRARRS